MVEYLKAFFGIRGFEMQMAEMSKGLFIFDEIHYLYNVSSIIKLKFTRRLGRAVNDQDPLAYQENPAFQSPIRENRHSETQQAKAARVKICQVSNLHAYRLCRTHVIHIIVGEVRNAGRIWARTPQIADFKRFLIV